MTANASLRQAELEGTGDRSTAVGLSVCCMTAGPGPRVAALLALLRDAADEIVVALDDRAGADVRDALAAVADRILLYPYREPVDRPLPWLFSQCRGEWVLSLDDDEVPSVALLDELPALVRARDVTHYSVPRRWLYPDASTYLDQLPWRPDYQLRLLRNDPQTTRFLDDFHRPLAAHGPGRFVEPVVWHLDPVLRSPEARQEKARRYELTRPGMRLGGLAHNHAFYVPELVPGARTAPVPPADQAVLAAVVSGEQPVGPAIATVERAEREEIDVAWPGTPLDAGAYAAHLELLEEPTPMVTAEQRTLDVRATNPGPRTWEWGEEARPQIRLAYRWRDEAGAVVVPAGLRTPFPAPVPPGSSEVVPVHIVAPDQPGRYRVEIDLVHEHVRWFGVPVERTVDVRARRLVGVVGDAAGGRLSLELLAHLPELEPVLVEPRDAEADASDLPRVAGVRAYIIGEDEPSPARLAAVLAGRLAAVARGAIATRRGGCVDGLPPPARTMLRTLGGCELLVVAGLDVAADAPLTRELAAVAALVVAARALGVRVAVRRGAIAAARPRDRALVRLIESRAAFQYEDAADLAARLPRSR